MRYKIRVFIETNEGKRKCNTITRVFSHTKELDFYVAGFADGSAVTVDGVILGSKITPLTS
jgi:hypothetical protein